MKKILDSIRAAFGLGSSAQESQTVDPKSILFTTPTMSNDTAELEPVNGQPTDAELFVNEDDWSQVEFLPGSLLLEVQRMLKEYKEFEQANRVGPAWRNVYLRKIPRIPMISGTQPVLALQTLLGVVAGAAPLLGSWSGVSGRVKNGFSVPLGGNITLYGYVTSRGISVLCASVGQNPDDLKLANAFTKLNAGNGLILVDWRTPLVLMSVSSGGQVEVWRP